MDVKSTYRRKRHSPLNFHPWAALTKRIREVRSEPVAEEKIKEEEGARKLSEEEEEVFLKEEEGDEAKQNLF